MKTIFILLVLISLQAHSSVIGISTHPLNEEARVLSAEMTGYMSQRNEMGAGLRYTQEVDQFKRLDVSAAGGQDSRNLQLGTGMDFEMFQEDINQPRISIKPYVQHQKFEASSATLLGTAPTIRKGFSTSGVEFFPYLAVPFGMKVDSDDNGFVYYSSLTFGASMPFPGGNNDRILLSLEGNRSMGNSSDYVGALVSWMWK